MTDTKEPAPLTAAQKATLKEKAEGPHPYVTIFAFELRRLLGEIEGYRQALEGIKKAHFGKIRGWNDRFICVRCYEPFPCSDFKIADRVLAGKEAQNDH